MTIKEARKIDHQYESELFSIDNKIKINTPPYWWQKSTDAVFLAIYEHPKIIGFVTVTPP
ncbi:hypothetical protein H1P_2660006 [Hyella patelloides LEGE 07179]|uniref:Uncharacterized protein n=1 Tax=Hyella patelloides LEGE 07179 TaxID=945734 RepID=A0A563VSP5_9CYAN|nr:hypothetical protein [Hyella patelloides]VEP14455.1 hypothetical protein H1P_2660006 [Hyella patelloides LEGE 07179]